MGQQATNISPNIIHTCREKNDALISVIFYQIEPVRSETKWKYGYGRVQ